MGNLVPTIVLIQSILKKFPEIDKDFRSTCLFKPKTLFFERFPLYLIQVF